MRMKRFLEYIGNIYHHNSAIIYAGVMVFFMVISVPFDLSAAPSFNCSKASTVIEKAICVNPELSDLDGKLAQLYSEEKLHLAGAERDQLIADQKEWIKHRNINCSFGSVNDCLLGSYRIRMNELSPKTFNDNAEVIDVMKK